MTYLDSPTTRFGEALRGQVEERLAFYETGSQPTKNSAAMERVIKQLRAEAEEGAVVEVTALPSDSIRQDATSTSKKSKKRKSDHAVLGNGDGKVEGVVTNSEDIVIAPAEKRIKKSKSKNDLLDVTSGGPLSAAPPALSSAPIESEDFISIMDVDGGASEKKKKKKKQKEKKSNDAKAITEPTVAEMIVDPVEVDTSMVKKDKKDKKDKKKSKKGKSEK